MDDDEYGCDIIACTFFPQMCPLLLTLVTIDVFLNSFDS